ncbi:NAD(P)/FAD-dependent oxidoreductase [Sulfurimonas indica]|uniref:NAD(P)/FAD-dependent oxidoreductase n=1 Tax=Sulfurimonas indica TaxID=2508707 RepID=UPI001263F9CC|nr:NAD(P)/FAD-dependent oxidoreductase [Sulfurimonas indica]
MIKNNVKKIVVIGAGYGGVRLVEKLSRNHSYEIALFDKNPYHFMQTDVYDLIANEVDFAKIIVDLYTLCSGLGDNVSFYNQEVKEIDFSHKRVFTDTQRFSYDYLVIAVGARTKFVKSIQGLNEYAHGVKALHRAMYFKQKFEMSLFRKVDASGAKCDPLNIVIAGAGLSGVEIAAQMASFAKEFYCKNHFLCRKLNIVLVNSSQKILKGMDIFLVEKSEKRLLNLGVTIKNNVRVASLTKEYVYLSNGESIAMDFMIFAGGIEPNGLIYKLDLQKDKRGFLLTNEFLQTPQYKEVFVIGDATILHKNEKIIAPTADVAEQMADICATNIELLDKGKTLRKHSIKSRGILISLGRNYAVAKVFGLFFDGYFAYCMKKFVEKSYAWHLDRKSKNGCQKIFK